MLENLKQEVLLAAKQAEQEGLCRHKSGNFSRRDPATGYICLTPSGVERRTMMVDDIVVISPRLEIVEAKGGRRPSSEALMHIAAYETRPELVAAAHTHSPFALVMAVLEKPIPAIVAEFAHLNCRAGVIPVAEYGRQGSTALADSVRQPLAAADAMLLAKHGVLAVSETSLADAYLKAAYVEEIAAVYYRALTITGGGEPAAVPLADLSLQSPQFTVKGEGK